MSPTNLILQPGTLAQKVSEQTTHALQCGALQPIPTDYEFIEDNNIRFLIRISSNFDRKDKAKKQETKDTNFNPFLPYEEDLFVVDISDSHLCLLNKYNVMDNHILIVTREFEEQESWLTLTDFEAMQACLAEIDGLVFYNSGKTAGASQRHKHLQLVPLPLIPEGESIPINPAIAAATFEDDIGIASAFPFLHAIAKLTSETAEATLESYFTLLGALDVTEKCDAYNLLATRKWMLLVPRSREAFESISINSLGFAGTFFVRNEKQFNLIKERGPITALTHVARSSIRESSVDDSLNF